METFTDGFCFHVIYNWIIQNELLKNISCLLQPFLLIVCIALLAECHFCLFFSSKDECRNRAQTNLLSSLQKDLFMSNLKSLLHKLLFEIKSNKSLGQSYYKINVKLLRKNKLSLLPFKTAH